MIPLFKSHYSIGKSILTLDAPSEAKEGAPSIVDIALSNGLKSIMLVEDSLSGFLEAKKRCDNHGLELRFGLRMAVGSLPSSKKGKKTDDCIHKIIIFAKNSDGCHLLNRLYSAAFTTSGGVIDIPSLKTFYNEKDLLIAIPFYDSFLFHNLFSYKKPCILDHSFFKPLFFIEDNDLPFDKVLRNAVEEYCEANDLQIEFTKSIYYENREDFEAYQTYKCICSRGFSSRARTLDAPGLDHCASPEFCFESYLDNESS